MNWNHFIREAHRWVALAFTLIVLAYIVVMAVGSGAPPDWLTYLPLLPLALLQLSGLYLFVLPYATKWRSRRHVAGS